MKKRKTERKIGRKTGKEKLDRTRKQETNRRRGEYDMTSVFRFVLQMLLSLFLFKRQQFLSLFP